MFHFCRFTLLLLFASALAAEPADWIWSARYVITEDARHRVIENGDVRAVRCQMQLKAPDVLEARRAGRSAEECSKILDGADIALLGLWR